MRLTPAEAFADGLEFLWQDQYGDQIGVAVSGGSDSLALLVLAHDWAKQHRFDLRAVTVDHRLRSEAAEEIAHVASVCRDLGIPHNVLVWDGWDGSGNLQAEARAARYALIDGWIADHGLDFVLLGHTADDQAETFLMRLARGSGVDGLAGMASSKDEYLRPLLGTTRQALRDMLSARHIEWCEDPSNEDDRFDRIKARKMMGHLAELGLTQDRILQTAQHMASAKLALEWAAYEFAKSKIIQQDGDLLIPVKTFYGVGGDTQSRVISGAIRWIGGGAYRPRYESLFEMAQRVAKGEKRTLQGVIFSKEGQMIRLAREFNKAFEAPLVEAVFEGPNSFVIWDQRWGVSQSDEKPNWFDLKRSVKAAPNLTIRALGESLKDVPDWRETGLPRASLMASPAVFDGETLISAPIAGLQNGFSARIVADYQSFLLSR